MVIRRADKASIFVILNKGDYFSKVGDILNDETKFKPLRRNPIDAQKRHLNTLIDAANDIIEAAGGARNSSGSLVNLVLVTSMETLRHIKPEIH